MDGNPSPFELLLTTAIICSVAYALSWGVYLVHMYSRLILSGPGLARPIVALLWQLLPLWCGYQGSRR